MLNKDRFEEEKARLKRLKRTDRRQFIFSFCCVGAMLAYVGLMIALICYDVI